MTQPGPLPTHGWARGLICDLDGVVYRGRHLCPGAAQGLALARDAGVGLVFLTNNAGRTAADVVQQLRGYGVAVQGAEVLTSAQVAAALIRRRRLLPAGTVVLAVGGPGVLQACREHQLDALTPAELTATTRVGVVLQGYGAGVTVADLSEAALAVTGGARWVATNLDATIPAERGTTPGNGALVDLVARTTGTRPDLVCGKPEPEPYRVALDRLGLPAADVLAVGDRVDTDVLGARRAGIPSALVLTGVHTRGDVARVGPDEAPDLVVEQLVDLAGCWRRMR